MIATANSASQCMLERLAYARCSGLPRVSLRPEGRLGLVEADD